MFLSLIYSLCPTNKGKEIESLKFDSLIIFIFSIHAGKQWFIGEHEF